MKLVYDELIPVFLEKMDNTTEFISYNERKRAALTMTGSLRLKYQLKNSDTGKTSAVTPIRENEVISLLGYDMIALTYERVEESQQVSLLLFK